MDASFFSNILWQSSYKRISLTYRPCGCTGCDYISTVLTCKIEYFKVDFLNQILEAALYRYLEILALSVTSRKL